MKYYKITYKKFLMLIVTILSFIIFFSMDEEILLSISNPYYQILCLLFIFSFHELLHGIGFRFFGKAESKNINYGISLEKGVLYCSCKEEISKIGILVSLALPLIFLTMVPTLTGILLDINILLYIGIVNLLGASFDIVLFIDIIKFPKDIKYKDLDDEMSFILISNYDLRKYKNLGIKISYVDNYDNELIKSNNIKKIKISKFSYVSIFLIIISIVISLWYNFFR